MCGLEKAKGQGTVLWESFAMCRNVHTHSALIVHTHTHTHNELTMYCIKNKLPL